MAAPAPSSGASGSPGVSSHTLPTSSAVQPSQIVNNTVTISGKTLSVTVNRVSYKITSTNASEEAMQKICTLFEGSMNSDAAAFQRMLEEIATKTTSCTCTINLKEANQNKYTMFTKLDSGEEHTWQSVAGKVTLTVGPILGGGPQQSTLTITKIPESPKAKTPKTPKGNLGMAAQNALIEKYQKRNLRKPAKLEKLAKLSRRGNVPKKQLKCSKKPKKPTG